MPLAQPWSLLSNRSSRGRSAADMRTPDSDTSTVTVNGARCEPPRTSGHHRGMSVLARAAAAVLAGFLSAACGITIPTDPDGTLDRVESSGVVRAGAAPR